MNVDQVIGCFVVGCVVLIFLAYTGLALDHFLSLDWVPR